MASRRRQRHRRGRPAVSGASPAASVEPRGATHRRARARCTVHRRESPGWSHQEVRAGDDHRVQPVVPEHLEHELSRIGGDFSVEARNPVSPARADGAFESGERVRHSAPVFARSSGGGEAGLDDGHERLPILLLERERDRHVLLWLIGTWAARGEPSKGHVAGDPGAVVTGGGGFRPAETARPGSRPARRVIGSA